MHKGWALIVARHWHRAGVDVFVVAEEGVLRCVKHFWPLAPPSILSGVTCLGDVYDRRDLGLASSVINSLDWG
jgi:hypothetical protein